VNGTLFNNLIQPLNSQKFLKSEENITIRGNVISDCSNEVLNESVTVNFTTKKGTTSTGCLPIFNELNGTYNCTFNTSSYATRDWNITFNSSKTNYIFNSTLITNVFFIETRPVLTNTSVTPGLGGWGERFYFSVNATDEDNDTMTVRLWLRKPPGNWESTPRNSTTVQGINVTVNLSASFTSGGSIGNWDFKFNITADDPTWDVNETSNASFTVEADDVRIELVTGNNSVANRSSLSGNENPNVTFGVKVFDADRNVPVPEYVATVFYVTKNGSTFVNLDTIQNETYGYFYKTLNPDCTYSIGPQKWKASSVSGYSWYKTVNSSDFYFNITTVKLSTALELPNNITRVRTVDNILLRGNVSDECPTLVTGASPIFKVERSGITYFTCPPDSIAYDEANGYYNCTVPNSSTSGWSTGWYNVTMEASKDYHNSSDVYTKENSFRLVTVPKIQNPVISTSSKGGGLSDFGWGETWTFKIDVQDEDNDNLNVSLWVNLTGDWQLFNSTYDSGAAHTVEFTGHNFTCSNIGTRQYKFNVTDIYAYENETSGTLEIIADDTTTYPHVGDDTQIDREWNDSKTLGVRIRDIDKSAFVGPSAQGKIFISTDGTNYDSGTSNTTDSLSYLYYTFNPNCSYSVGLQNWFGGPRSDTCYKDSDSPIFTTNITGQLKVNITNPVEDSNILVGEIVNLNTSIYDECSYLVNGSNVKHEARSPNLQFESVQPVTDQNNGYYNSTWNTSFHMGGNWGLRINASKPDYYSNSTLFADWVYLNNTPSVAENASVSPSSAGWGTNFTFGIDVDDTQYDNITCKLFTYTTGSWVYRGSTTVYNGKGTCYISVNNFTCSDINTTLNWFKFQIEDGTNTFNTSNVSAPVITSDDVVIYYVYGNNSNVNRSGESTGLGDTTLFILGANDTTKGNVAINGGTITFYVTTDGNDFLSNSNTTNSTGFAHYYFNPDCSYSPGLQKWKGNVTDSCYAINGTINYTTKVYGDFNYTPKAYQQDVSDDNMILKTEQNLTIGVEDPPDGIMRVKDECASFVNVTTITMEAVQNSSRINYTCNEIVQYATGVYRCNRNTSDMQAGLYDIVVNVSKPWFNNVSQAITGNFFIETRPILTSPNVSSQDYHNATGGYGETFNFSVNVTDEDLDNVTVTLYLKPTGLVDWYETKSTWVESAINETLYMTANITDLYLFDCAHKGQWQYKFIATDNRSYSKETYPENMTIEEDDLRFEYGEGNNTIVYRNGTDNPPYTTHVSLLVIDDDSNTVVASASGGMVWFTNNYSSIPTSWDGGSSALGNASGYLWYDFDPTCIPTKYEVGTQKWKGGVKSNNCYKDTNSSGYWLTIKSNLMPNVLHPLNNKGFLQGSPVTINSTISDDCGLMGGATTEFKLKTPNAPNRYCTNKVESGGYYNCTWDSNSYTTGSYDITLTASKTYYETNYTFVSGAFFLGISPSLSSPAVDHSIGGWGENFKFAVTFSDADGTTDNVTLWKSLDNSTWTLVSSKIISGVGKLVTFSKDCTGISNCQNYSGFICSDYLTATNGLNYYKFNVSDPYLTEAQYNYQTEVKNFTLDVDNVTLTIGGNSNSTVRRIGNNQAYLRFVIYDSDRTVYTNDTNGTVWITRNGVDYDYNITCLSSYGNCSIDYNPDCNSSAGVNYWKAGTTDVCYQSLNTSNVSLTVYGQLNVSLIYPTSGTILNHGRTTNLNGSVSNDCSQQISDANISWYNATWVLLASGYNTTWYVPTGYALGTKTIYSNATRQYYDGNSNNTQVHVYGWSDIDSISPTNTSSYPSGSTVTVRCHVMDGNSSQSIGNYPVLFYKNGAFLDTNTTDSQGYASTDWSTSTEFAGWYNLTCKIVNNSTLYYNASVPQKETWVTLGRPLIIDQISRQYTSIYRNNSFIPYQTNISVHTYDANIGNADNSTVTFYNSTDSLGNCTTNSSGWCDLINFNPGDTTTPGVYTIYINATRPQNQNSETNTTTITVKGILNITIISPPDTSNCGTTGLICPKSASITLRANGTSENGESFAVLNPTIRWYNETAQIATGIDTSLSQQGVAEQRTGEHKFMAMASKTYYDNGGANATLNITGLSDVIWVSPTGILPYPDTFTPTCQVKDHNSLAGISEYVVNVSYKWEPSSDFTFNGSYISNTSGYVSYSFIPEQKGNITFNCTIGENVTQYYTANIPSVAETLWVKDTRSPQIYNTSILPNTSIEANLNSTNITATITDNYQIDSVWANITMPNQSTIILSMQNMTVPEVSFGFYRATYMATYTPPIEGVYNVSVYAMDAAPENNINSTVVGNFSVWGRISGLVEQLPSTITAFGVTQIQSYTFEISSNFTNLGPATAYTANLTHSEDPSGTLSYNETSKQCGTLYSGQTCSWIFTVTVPTKTSPQLIRSYVVSTWRNPDYTTQQTLNETSITVSSNPMIEVTPDGINKSTPHGATTYVGNMTTASSGNDEIRDVAIGSVGGNIATDCPLCALDNQIVPNEYGLLAAGENFTSDISITVPVGQAPGVYWTKIRASSSNAGYDELLLNLTISQNTSWSRTPETFGMVLLPLNTSGTIGNITVTNIGNMKIPFEILKSGNGTIFVSAYPSGSPSTTAFDLEKQTTRNVTVSYSISASATQAIYTVNIVIRNVTSANPTERITNITLNVTDIPPTITDVLITPTAFEIGYENVSVSAKITDNFAVDMAWIDVTPPNSSTYIQFMSQSINSSIYNTTYNSLLEGYHQIKICANDTRSLSGCTSTTMVEGSATTRLAIIPNATTITMNDITIEDGQNSTINITLNNTGGSRASYSNLTVNYTNVSAEPTFFDFGTILKWTSRSNTTRVIVPNGTMAGIYYINLTADWVNLNNTVNSSSSLITVNVTSNPKIKILEQNLTKIIPVGTKDNVTFNLKSIGNENATEVNITCKSGKVCQDLNVSFSSEYFSSISIGKIKEINASFEVLSSYEAGTHNGTIEVTWYQNKSAQILVFITIPVNISWSHQPLEIYKEVLQNETGYYGSINITNTGNAEINLSIVRNGSTAPYLVLSEYNITVPYSGQKTIYINYSSPDITIDTNYTGFIISNITGALRENSTQKIDATSVNMFVLVYRVRIISPNQSNPMTGVHPNDSIIIKANVTKNDTVITGNVTFNVSVFNSTLSRVANVTLTTYNSTEKLWWVTLTAPNLTLARVYSLNATATYNGTTYLVKSSIEYDSIVYSDTQAPQITISINPRVPANSTTTIRVNVTETGGIKNITGNMTYPNGTIENISLIFVSKDGDLYRYELNFTKTYNLGNYTFNVTACDLSGNCGYSSSSFEIYPTIIFSGYAKNYELMSEPPIDVNFILYDVGTNVVIPPSPFRSNISAEGYYNETIDAKSYDLEIGIREPAFSHKVKLYNMNLSTNYFNPIIFGNVPTLRTTSTAVKGIYLDTILSPSTFVLTLNFSDCVGGGCNVPIYNPNNLGIYKYGTNWTRKISSSQNTLWTRLTNLAGDNSDYSVNLTTFTASVNVSSSSGVYILAEFICGNGECETDTGESTSICPIDCPSIPPPPTATTVPGGGGGGGGTGGGAGLATTTTAPRITTGPEVTFVPVEIKSTLLETTLVPGEEKLFSIDVTNNLEDPVSVTVVVEGPAFQLLTIQKPVFTVDGKSTEVTTIKAYAHVALVPGLYTGDLVVTANEIVHRTPITIKIQTVQEPLLDVKVKVLSKGLNPGTNLTFEASLINMGETAKVEDITVTFNVRPINDQNEIITTIKETLAVENVLTFRKSVEIPRDVKEGRYIIEANASYWHGSKYATASDNFDVTVLPLPLFLLRTVFMSWITYVVLLGGIPAIIITTRWLAAHRAAKVAKARYIAPVEFKKLPQVGPSSIEVGRIAETDVRAYIDIPQLIMHSIAAGGSGSGKSVSAMVCSEELLKRKVPIIVFDPTAQWTGFMKPCRLQAMLDLYPKFGVKPTDARGFKTNVILVEDPDMQIDIKKYMNPGEMTVFVMNRLPPEKLDNFVRRSVQSIFDMRPSESKEIKFLLVYDEVHRLLPKYGGKGGYIAIERACREFRKWGIGVFLISQVLLDFKGAIRANIANEIQLRTKYEGDLGRVKSKYGMDYASKVTKLTIGTGLFQNPEYNYGKPWFVSFRPLLHSPFALTDDEINQYVRLNKKIEDIEKTLGELKAKKVDTYDVEIELNIAKDKVRTAAFKMAETYLESIEKRVAKMGGK
jgi:hypothetical protein